MSVYIPAFAKATVYNDWSHPKVTDYDQTRSFKQQEVLYSSLNPQIYAWAREALDKSGYGTEKTIEVGFFVTELEGGFLEHEPVTSEFYGGIFQQDLDDAFNTLLDKVELKDVRRNQFYHTHPEGISSLTISREDVDCAIALQENAASRGAKVPFDMHAMPHDLAAKGYFKKLQAPDLWSDETPPPILIPIAQPLLLRMTVEP